jgi:hypothetical protein
MKSTDAVKGIFAIAAFLIVTTTFTALSSSQNNRKVSSESMGYDRGNKTDQWTVVKKPGAGSFQIPSGEKLDTLEWLPSPEDQSPPLVLLSLNKSVRSDVRGNLGHPSVITQESVSNWLTDRWQGMQICLSLFVINLDLEHQFVLSHRKPSFSKSYSTYFAIILSLLGAPAACSLC